MIKKLISLITVLCSTFTSVTYAAGSPVISVGNVVASPGDEITVPVEVMNNPGFAALKLDLNYNSQALTPVDIIPGEVLGELEILSNIQQSGDLSKYNPVTMLVISAKDIKKDGVLYTVKFAVNDDAVKGASKFNISYDREDVANAMLDNVDFGVADGILTVKDGKDPPKDNSVSTVKPEATGMPQQTPLPVEAPANDENKEIDVTIDGVPVIFGQPPIIVNESTLVPMRFIFEALGAEVSWEQETATAVGTKDNICIRIQINNKIITKNSKEIELETPAQLVNERTLVPIRAVAEAFGCGVEWVDKTKSVIIKTQ